MKPTKNRVYCRALGRTKMLFESESKATNFIKFNHDIIEDEAGYAPGRAYYCEACCGWHVTHSKLPPSIDITQEVVKKYRIYKEKIETEQHERREDSLEISHKKKEQAKQEIEQMIADIKNLERARNIKHEAEIILVKLKRSGILTKKQVNYYRKSLENSLNILSEKKQ